MKVLCEVIFYSDELWVFVQYEFILVVESLKFDDCRVIIALHLIDSKDATLDKFPGVRHPVDKMVLLDDLDHLLSSHLVGGCRFEQLLHAVNLIFFLRRCDDLDSWHSNLYIELFLNDVLPTNLLDNT